MVEANAESNNPLHRVPNFLPIDKSTWDLVKDKLPNSTFQKNRARLYRLFKD